MLENSIYSILSPEGFSSILWKDSKRAAEAAEVMKLTALDLKQIGIIDDIINEANNGTNINNEITIKNVKEALIKELADVMKMDTEVMLNKRYEKFRKIGV